MPFTIGGEWIPNTPEKKSTQKPVKVRLVKRGNNTLTVILNLNLSHEKLSELSSALKRKLGVGGAIKDGTIEIQGDKLNEVKRMLHERNIKAS